MSASLVGSEMCIRDRSYPLSCCPFRGAAGDEELCMRSGDVEARRKRRAVSYTHLTLPTICSV
eukprot:5171591-Alexandrium_andersonii.AAC.1